MKYFNRYNRSDRDFVTPGLQLKYMAEEKGDEIAIVYIDYDDKRTELSWNSLHRQSNRLAWYLKSQGIDEKSVCAVALPNTIEHFIAIYAIWKLGACYMPLSRKMPESDVKHVMEKIDPAIIFSEKPLNCINSITPEDFNKLNEFSDEMPEDRIANPNIITASGGTTGTPKYIKQNVPYGLDDRTIKMWFKMSGMDFDMTNILVGPLFHGAPHSTAVNGIFLGHKMIVPRDLRVENIISLIKEFQVEYMQTVPTLLNRIAKTKGITAEDLSSLRAVCHTGGFCSGYLKEEWIELIGAKKLYEIYSMSETIGITAIRGDDWLKHKGSTGKPLEGSSVSIRDKNGNELPAGQVGEIYMTSPAGCLITEYINRPQLPEDHGFRSVGDMGYVDEDGYLYYVDRRSDMFCVKGENVFSAEVESVLLRHNDIIDAIVIGIPDEDTGKRLHAIIQVRNGVTEKDIREYLEKYLEPYKIPSTFEFRSCLRRGPSGKINRARIMDEYSKITKKRMKTRNSKSNVKSRR